MPRLLVVHHSPTENVRLLADAAIGGARTAEAEGVDVVVRQALEATAEDVLAADAYLFGTTANFGYISGALKHFFDSTYDAVREVTASRPFSSWIHGGHDTTGAEQAMTAITRGFGLRLAAAPLACTGPVTPAHTAAAEDLGGTVAWGLVLTAG